MPGGEARDLLQRLQAILEHDADGFCLVSGEGVVEYVSPSAARILGRPPQEFLGRSGRDYSHPADVESYRPAFADLAASPGASCVMVSRIAMPDGSLRWIEWTLTNLLHEPAVRAITVHFRDVTARRAAEEALRRSEANFRRVIETSPTATLIARGDRIEYVNRAMVELLRDERPEGLLGRSPMGLLQTATAETRRTVAKLERGEGPSVAHLGEQQMLRGDGSSVDVELDVTRFELDGVPALGFSARDLSEKRAFMAMLAASDRLASMGTLAAGVAHEINNPIGYVQATLSLLAEELPAAWEHHERSRLGRAEVEQLLHDAMAGVARVRSVVKDLRAMSRAEEAPGGPTDVHEVLRSSLRLADAEIRHRARLDERLGDLPPVAADPSRLGQVLINLLVNAAHAIPDGHADENVIQVSTYVSAAGEVVIEVADTGSGIAPDVLGHVFDPFFTTKPVGVGTGLGLWICHGIVKSVGGRIEVQSEVGRGTTFRVFLPACVGRRPPPLPAAKATGEGARARVLVVDDERSMGTVLRLSLEPDHEVVALTSAARALERIEAERFDVVLCDLMMPEVNGMHFHQELRRRAPQLANRVVFMTGGAFTPATREFLESAPVRWLEKPFEIDEVRRLIREMLEGERPRG